MYSDTPDCQNDGGGKIPLGEGSEDDSKELEPFWEQLNAGRNEAMDRARFKFLDSLQAPAHHRVLSSVVHVPLPVGVYFETHCSECSLTKTETISVGRSFRRRKKISFPAKQKRFPRTGLQNFAFFSATAIFNLFCVGDAVTRNICKLVSQLTCLENPRSSLVVVDKSTSTYTVT